MLRLASPAKVNLFLRILRRRADGYHELASLFQAIDLCDTLHVSLASQDRLTCNIPTLPVDHTNLISKAVDLFRRRVGQPFAVEIHLDKHIPMEAGLGGGSSNAATTLWALNTLLDHPATLDQLIAWGGELGSDVAFFLSEGTAYCTGRGEVIVPQPALASQNLLIVKPAVGLPTPEVYRRVNAATLPQRDPQESLQQWLKGEPSFYNDLEPAACAALPYLLTLKEQLIGSGFEQVLLAGSGSSFICFGDGSPPRLSDVQLFPARFLRRSPHSWY